MATADAIGTVLTAVGGAGTATGFARRFASREATASPIAEETINVIPSSRKTFVTNSGSVTFDIPKDYSFRFAENGTGSVYQKIGSEGNANQIRIMDPTDKNPAGYVRVYNEFGQPIDLLGKPTSRLKSHIPQDFTGKWIGWPE